MPNRHDRRHPPAPPDDNNNTTNDEDEEWWETHDVNGDPYPNGATFSDMLWRNGMPAAKTVPPVAPGSTEPT